MRLAGKSILFPVSAALALAACWIPDERIAAGSATEVTNGGKLTGRIVMPGGLPAEGVGIRVRPDDYLRDTSLWAQGQPTPDARTDAQGYFQVDKLPHGSYVLEALDDRGLAVCRAFAFQEGIKAEDTLQAVGFLQGRVELPEVAQGRTFVQIYGLDRLILVAPGGGFSAPGLAPGKYRLRVVYPFLDRAYEAPDSVRISSGDTTVLDVIKLIEFNQEDYSTWPYSLPMEVDAGSAGISDTVMDFPLLVRLSAAHIDFSQSDGSDIRFSGPGGRRVPYQVDYWDAAKREAAVWVRFDTLPGGGSPYPLTLHWGKRNAPDFSRGPEVFTTFAGAWHLSKNLDAKGDTTVLDASPSRAHGEAQLVPGVQGGVIGAGAEFLGDHLIRVPATEGLKPRDALTLSLWVNLPAQPNHDAEMINMGNNYALRSTLGSLIFVAAPDIPDWHTTHTGEDRRIRCSTAKTIGLVQSGWRHVAAVYEGDSLRTYLDGVPLAVQPFSFGIAYVYGDDFVLGQHPSLDPTFRFVGRMDEAQVSTMARSRAWIRLAFESQRPGSTLVRLR